MSRRDPLPQSSRFLRDGRLGGPLPPRPARYFVGFTLFGANCVARLFVAEKQNFRSSKPKEKCSRGGWYWRYFETLTQ